MAVHHALISMGQTQQHGELPREHLCGFVTRDMRTETLCMRSTCAVETNSPVHVYWLRERVDLNRVLCSTLAALDDAHLALSVHLTGDALICRSRPTRRVGH